MLSLTAAVPSYLPAVTPTVTAPRASVRMETQKDLVALADAQKIPMGFWDPLDLSGKNFWDQGNEATIGFLRHAEIKHGRVAMAAFVGFCVQSNGIHFPWDIKGGPLGDPATSVSYGDISALPAPGDQWDAVPAAGKLQILGALLLLEWLGEEVKPHYMRGGKPGYYPPLKESSKIPHPVPFDLYDPFSFFTNDSAEKKARGLSVEINNGRAAMLGIFGLMSASKGLIVPGLDNIGVAPYGGEYMGFYGPNDALALVDNMYSQLGSFPWNGAT